MLKSRSVSGLDSLACHKVEEREGQIIVTADKRELVTGRRLIRITEITEDSEERIVIVGGGAAGQSAAETLRSASGIQYPYLLIPKYCLYDDKCVFRKENNNDHGRHQLAV